MEHPELDKMNQVHQQASVLSEFYDWLREQGYHLCELRRDGPWIYDMWMPITKSPEQLFAAYFDINLDKVEAERREILKDLRNRRPA